MSTISGVYRITNMVNGKFYVGSAADVKARWRAHRWALNAGRHSNSKLQRAWDKYGADAFVFSVLETVPDVARLLQREQEWLDIFECVLVGYNIALVAGSPTRGLKASEETKAKMSAAMKGRPGVSPSAETRDKLSAKLKGRKLSDETRAKMSASRMGRKFSEESKAKMSASAKGKTKSEAHRAALAAAQTGKKDSEETRLAKSKAAKQRVIDGTHNWSH